MSSSAQPGFGILGEGGFGGIINEDHKDRTEVASDSSGIRQLVYIRRVALLLDHLRIWETIAQRGTNRLRLYRALVYSVSPLFLL